MTQRYCLLSRNLRSKPLARVVDDKPMKRATPLNAEGDSRLLPKRLAIAKAIF